MHRLSTSLKWLRPSTVFFVFFFSSVFSFIFWNGLSKWIWNILEECSYNFWKCFKECSSSALKRFIVWFEHVYHAFKKVHILKKTWSSWIKKNGHLVFRKMFIMCLKNDHCALKNLHRVFWKIFKVFTKIITYLKKIGTCLKIVPCVIKKIHHAFDKFFDMYSKNLHLLFANFQHVSKKCAMCIWKMFNTY